MLSVTGWLGSDERNLGELSELSVIRLVWWRFILNPWLYPDDLTDKILLY